jgi:hypothetical protein
MPDLNNIYGYDNNWTETNAHGQTIDYNKYILSVALIEFSGMRAVEKKFTQA